MQYIPFSLISKVLIKGSVIFVIQMALFLCGVMTTTASHALPQGVVTNTYNGPLPSDATYFCDEGRTCAVSGVKELWYGARESWGFRLASGNVFCSFQEFTDVLYGVGKKCYIRNSLQTVLMPPQLAYLPVAFNLYDLLTAESGRYKASVVINGKHENMTQEKSDKVLTKLSTANSSIVLPQSVFQFTISDTRSPAKDYAVIVSATMSRCLLHHRDSASSTEVSIGRMMDVYTMTSRPDGNFAPFRSDVQKLCTNDKGQLAIHILAPGAAAFPIKVVSYGYAGHANEVTNMMVPTQLNWLAP